MKGPISIAELKTLRSKIAVQCSPAIVDALDALIEVTEASLRMRDLDEATGGKSDSWRVKLAWIEWTNAHDRWIAALEMVRS